jgi:hypothetical protein
MALRPIETVAHTGAGGPRTSGQARGTRSANTQAPKSQPPPERSPGIVDLSSRSVEMTIIAQDPTILSVDKAARILTAKVKVPSETLRPGPRSHRFFVVDYDLSTGRGHRPVEFEFPKGKFHDRFDDENIRNSTLTNSRAFHAQNVFAIATRTLSLFEYYLGRRVPWAVDSHELFLVPNAQLQGNAYYDHNAHAVLFGYVKPRKGSVVRTCLSHDIVAHEVTHAILDGLRPYYLQPGLPDQSALHEAFADLVALLSVFEIKEVLLNQFRWLARENTDPDQSSMIRHGQLPESAVKPEELEKTVLFAIAEQLGNVQLGQRAIRYPKAFDEGNWWRDNEEYIKPHRRSEIVVAAVMRTLRDMWITRLEPLIHRVDDPWLDLDRAVEEGTKVANYLLGMIIRALDYMPPVDIDFEYFLDGVLAADEIVSPDDPFDYRTTLEHAFNAFGIYRPKTNRFTYGKGGIPKPDTTNLNFNSLRHDRDEVFRFIWNNPKALQINLDYPLFVNRVRATTRVGPDGMVVEEVVAEYTQNLCITAAELPKIQPSVKIPGLPSRMRRPPGLKPDAKVQLWGGGALIFNQFGKLHLHQRRSLALTSDDIQRQQDRLDYLVKHNHVAKDGSVGFLTDPGRTLRHEADEFDEELW